MPTVTAMTPTTALSALPALLVTVLVTWDALVDVGHVRC
jgi:hypothetical protein